MMKPLLVIYFFSADSLEFYEMPFDTNVIALHGKTYKGDNLTERQEHMIRHIVSTPQIEYDAVELENYSTVVCIGWCY
jgi:hypothetical protein